MTFAVNTGTYTPATGAETAAAGQTIQSAVWNAIFTDLSNALTQTMSQLLGAGSEQAYNMLWANGGFEIWQRGAGASAVIAVASATTAYTADRWYVNTAASTSVSTSAQAGIGVSASLIGSNLSMKVVNSAGSGAVILGYPLDTESCAMLRGQTVSISFLAKAGASWSPASGTLTYNMYAGTGSVGKQSGGFTNQQVLATGSVNLSLGGSTVQTIKTGTVAAAVGTTQAEFQFTWTPVSAAGGNDFVQIDDVIVQINNSATAWTISNFSQMDRVPFSACLVDCQQHYWKSFPYGTAPAQTGGVTGSLATLSQGNIKAAFYVRFPVPMRAAPALTTYNPSGATANWQDVTAVASLAVTVTATSSVCCLLIAATAAATDHQLMIHAAADAGI